MLSNTEPCNVVILYVVYIIYFNIFYVFICCGGRSCAFTGQVSWKQPSESLCLPAVYSGNEFEGKLEGAAALLTQHVTPLWRAKAKLVKNKPPQPNKSKKKPCFNKIIWKRSTRVQRRLRCNSWVAAACEEGVPEPGSLCISCSAKDLGKQAAQPVPFLRVTQLLGHNKQCRCRDGPPSPQPAQLMLDSSNSLRFELSFDKILRTDCRVYMESLASFTGTKSNMLLPTNPAFPSPPSLTPALPTGASSGALNQGGMWGRLHSLGQDLAANQDVSPHHLLQ